MTKQESDNLDKDPAQTPEKDNSVITQDAETDAKKKRHEEQQSGARAEVARIRQLAVDAAYVAAQSSAQSLLDLHAKDPSLANEVSQKFGYTSFDAARKSIEAERQGVSDSDFDARYDQRRAQERHEESVELAHSIISKAFKDEDLKEEAITYFNEIAEGKKLDPKKAKRFADTATLYVNKDKLKEAASREALAQLGNVGLGTPRKEPEMKKSDGPSEVIISGRLVTLNPNKSK